MCDHSNDPGGREAAMVVLDPGTPERHGRDGVWCDPCLVPLIKALNDGGVRTSASCCGHGATDGWIILGDGRTVGIFASLDRAHQVMDPDFWASNHPGEEAHYPQIAAQDPAGQPKRRLRGCVENWPEAETGEYNPSCCRFPKSCSATVYSEEHVTDADLEPQIATHAPAGQPEAPSGGRGTSGGLGERLRAAADYQDRPGAYDELRAMADEVDRLENEAEMQGHSTRSWRVQAEHARAQVEAIRAAITREAAHGDAITRCNLVAERFQTVLDSVGEERP